MQKSPRPNPIKRFFQWSWGRPREVVSLVAGLIAIAKLIGDGAGAVIANETIRDFGILILWMSLVIGGFWLVGRSTRVNQQIDEAISGAGGRNPAGSTVGTEAEVSVEPDTQTTEAAEPSMALVPVQPAIVLDARTALKDTLENFHRGLQLNRERLAANDDVNIFDLMTVHAEYVEWRQAVGAVLRGHGRTVEGFLFTMGRNPWPAAPDLADKKQSILEAMQDGLISVRVIQADVNRELKGPPPSPS